MDDDETSGESTRRVSPFGQGYVRRGLIEAREEGEGVNKTFLISIDSLNALRDRRNREVRQATKFAEAAAEEERSANLYANAGEALRHAIERVEARTVEATELRIRLEITEKAQSTLRAELEEERRKREVAERERDELHRRLEARPEPPGAPTASTPEPERAEHRSSTGGPQAGDARPRDTAEFPRRGSLTRPWWRRVFGR